MTSLNRQVTARPVATWDPLQLGVHRAIAAGAGGGRNLPELTPYVERAHDRVLRDLLAGPQRPIMTLLVGGSSAGKTRSAYEAVREYLPDWQLVCPVDAADLASWLADSPAPARTVVWVNEAQVFLRDQPGVATGLRRLLAGEQPLVVAGTIWPEFWEELAAGPADGTADVNFQARELLRQAVRVDVPDAFTAADRRALLERQPADPRLALAAESSRADGRVAQALAGGPELVRRYEYPATARGRYATALVTAAMDMRRLGCESPVPPQVLEQAAAEYLDPADRAYAPADWFRDGLGDATAGVHGIAALTPRRSSAGVGPADGLALHDYLDQHGRRTRLALPVPPQVWNALAGFAASPADRSRVAQQAQARGLYRLAVMLARPAAKAGDAAAMQVMAQRLDDAGHGQEALQWWQRSALAGNLTAVLTLAQKLSQAGDHQGAESVLRAAADAGNSIAAASLAAHLDETGRPEAADQALRRAASAGDSTAMQRLSERLDKTGDPAEAEAWLRRAAESGDPMAQRSLASRLENSDGFTTEVEQLHSQAASSGDFMARSDMVYLAVRQDEAGRSLDAEQWWHRAASVGDSSAMWLLAGRHQQAGDAAEAEHWRRQALESGSYFALSAAMDQIEKTGGTIQDFERLLTSSLEGDGAVIARLVSWLEKSGHRDEADQWLREAAEAGHLIALHFLAGRAEQAGQIDQAQYWKRRLTETGTYGGPYQAVLHLEKTDAEHADRLRRYGIEPGGAISSPW